jgi:hypothetical protein
MQRDGKQFLHVTSFKPVDGDHLHLYLELVDGAHRSVRLSTLWLGADPNPAPAPPVAASARESATPAPNALLPPGRQTLAAPALHPASALTPTPAPTPPAVRAPSPAPASPSVRGARPLAGRLAPPAAMAHAPLLPKAAPIACTEQPHQEAQACLALDARNAALRAKIVLLEEKVKGLQVSMKGAQVEAPKLLSPVKLAAPGPTLIAPRKQRKNGEAGAAGMPWLPIGLGALAVLALAAGAAALWRWRRKKEQPGRAAAARDGLKNRLMPGP